MGKKVFVDLSHPFGADIPLWPYFQKPVIDTMHGLAKSGVLSQKVTVVMHAGTHADSPRHVMERDFDGKRARYTHELPVDAYFGHAICLDVKVEAWELITDKHLDDACERANFDPKELKRHGALPAHRHAPAVRRQQGLLPLFRGTGLERASGSRSTCRSAWPWTCRPWTIRCTPPWARTAPPR